jgi:hypothetical protein
MRAIVIGAGEVATALSASLAANGRMHAVQMRDMETRDDMRQKQRYSSFRSSFVFSDMKTKPLLLSWEDTEMPQVYAQEPLRALLVAVPTHAFAAEGTPDNVLHRLTSWIATHRKHTSSDSVKPPILTTGQQDGSDVRVDAPPIVVFSRGLLRNGQTPAQVIEQHFRTVCDGGPLPSVIVGCGNFVPREWVQESLRVASSISADIDNGDPLATPSVVSLAFAAASSGASFQSRESVARLFAREQSAMLECSDFGLDISEHAIDPSEVLSVISAVLPLVSFGAGMLSNEYPASVSALSLFVANAVESCNGLLEALFAVQHHNKVLRDDPLAAHLLRKKNASSRMRSRIAVPPVLMSSFVCAAANQSAKEFALGRQMRAQFRQQDAIRATYGNLKAPHIMSLENTIEGLSVRMAAANAKIPWFESIMDAFHTFRRADDVGKRLVSIPACASNAVEERKAAGAHSLLSCVKAVDVAVETGSGFDEARKKMATLFAGDSHALPTGL